MFSFQEQWETKTNYSVVKNEYLGICYVKNVINYDRMDFPEFEINKNKLLQNKFNHLLSS